eukprot:g1755.t1
MESDSNDRHEGIVKFFRGSFGWVRCSDVAQKIGDRDIFLHKNQLNSVPTAGDVVEFKLVVDAKGQPKAEDAVVVKGDTRHVAKRQSAAGNEKDKSNDMKAVLRFRCVDLSEFLEVAAATHRPPLVHDPNRRFKGSVRSWNPDGGFGFIVCAESRAIYNKDIFLHKSEIGHEPDLYKLRRRLEFKDGEPVSFQVEYDDKQKPRAKHVELLDQPKEAPPEPKEDPQKIFKYGEITRNTIQSTQEQPPPPPKKRRRRTDQLSK